MIIPFQLDATTSEFLKVDNNEGMSGREREVVREEKIRAADARRKREECGKKKTAEGNGMAVDYV